MSGLILSALPTRTKWVESFCFGVPESKIIFEILQKTQKSPSFYSFWEIFYENYWDLHRNPCKTPSYPSSICQKINFFRAPIEKRKSSPVLESNSGSNDSSPRCSGWNFAFLRESPPKFHSTPSITSVHRPRFTWISHDRCIFELRIDGYHKKSRYMMAFSHLWSFYTQGLISRDWEPMEYHIQRGEARAALSGHSLLWIWYPAGSGSGVIDAFLE